MSKKFIAAIVVLTLAVVYFGVSWGFTQQDLDATRTVLSDTRLTLASNKQELSNTKDELSIITAELQDTEDNLSNIEAELQVTRDDLATMEAELEDTKAELSALQAEPLYLHNPTFDEVISFLEEDRTDSNPYIEGEYVCTHFARDVNNNAEDEGIRCAFVAISFPRSAHAIVAFDTTDQGLVYFDPQADERVIPVIGKQYWRCVVPRPGYYYPKPSFDDTILDIVVIW
jgi:hypothetical protein